MAASIKISDATEKRRAQKRVRPGATTDICSKADGASAAEAVAREAVEAGAFSAKTVAKALAMTHIPLSASRTNVIPDGMKAVHGMILGMYVYSSTVGVSLATARRPWLTKLLVGFLRSECGEGKPFTSIQVNMNYAAKLHVDRNNLGTSHIVGLGNYTGGDLWVEDHLGDYEKTLPEDIVRSSQYRQGTTWNGRSVNIRNRWFEFDGNKLHCTEPFQGTRYTLVYFSCDRFAEAPAAVKKSLYGYGIRFPTASAVNKMLSAKRFASKVIQKSLAKERSLGRSLGPHLVGVDRVKFCAANPKQPGCQAHARFERYRTAATVAEALALGCLKLDLCYDYECGYMEVVALYPSPFVWDTEIPGARGGESRVRRGQDDRAAKGMLRVRSKEMSWMTAGVLASRANVHALAARCPALQAVTDGEWCTKDSPTASVSLTVLRSLLHWARTGNLRFDWPQIDEFREVLHRWGAHEAAALLRLE